MSEHEAGEQRSAPGSEGDRFSFWKPDPLPPKDAQILPINLLSLGHLREVAERLFEVPRMAKVFPSPWEESRPDAIRLRWEVEDGVVLRIRAEEGPPRPGEVLTICAESKTSRRVFYRLYVQLYEQFGVTVLDERQHDFMTPKEFRSRMAG